MGVRGAARGVEDDALTFAEGAPPPRSGVAGWSYRVEDMAPGEEGTKKGRQRRPRSSKGAGKGSRRPVRGWSREKLSSVVDRVESKHGTQRRV